MRTWKLKKGAEGPTLRGHPWVFARDLDQPDGREQTGSFVRLTDFKGNELAFGYGNLESAISFRSLGIKGHPRIESMMSVGPQGADFQDWLLEKIAAAWARRKGLGFRDSHRVVFSEADGLPGLILDRYLLKHGTQQVMAAQILTAGAERFWGEAVGLMEKLVTRAKADGLSRVDWDHTFVVERKDVSVRKHEGLAVQAPRILKFPSNFADHEAAAEFLKSAPVELANLGQVSIVKDQVLELTADLYEGQKTGFFLDQTLNMAMVMQWLDRRGGSSLKVLDLCSYVGNWSLQLGAFAKERGWDFETCLVDISGEALRRAQLNVERAGVKARTFELDVMKDIDSWPQEQFDIVIADPPAFVKAKKDLSLGMRAYQKLNTMAAKRVKPGGFLVSCSCSGGVSENELTNVLPEAFKRAGREGRLIARGNQSPDHPWDPAFPEGRYLKMILCQLW